MGGREGVSRRDPGKRIGIAGGHVVLIELAAKGEQLLGDLGSRIQSPEKRSHGMPDHWTARQLVVNCLRRLLRDLLRDEAGLSVEPAAERGASEAIVVGRLPEPEQAVLASRCHRGGLYQRDRPAAPELPRYARKRKTASANSAGRSIAGRCPQRSITWSRAPGMRSR